MTVVVIFHHIGPYHHARLNSAGKILDIVGMEWSAKEFYPWGNEDTDFWYKKVSLFDYTHWKTHSWLSLLSRLSKVLDKFKPRVVVVNGWNDFGSLITIYCCARKSIPIILMSESKEDDAPRQFIAEKIKGLIIKLCNSALVGGSKHKSYLIKLGIPESAIFLGYDVVNNNRFNPNIIRKLPNFYNTHFFLAVNRFVPKKNLHFLISAYAKYHNQNKENSWHLVLCGDGNLRLELENLITKYKLKNFIHLPGFLQQEELLPYFAHASCFIHASIQEQWGLVVNEAMAAGLPVLISNRCGCYEDLIIEGVNGFGFDPENVQQLTNLMVKMSSGEVDLNTMSHAALEHIQKFSPDYFAQGLTQAVEYALTHK